MLQGLRQRPEERQAWARAMARARKLWRRLKAFQMQQMHHPLREGHWWLRKRKDPKNKGPKLMLDEIY
eukprot:g2563.t1